MSIETLGYAARWALVLILHGFWKMDRLRVPTTWHSTYPVRMQQMDIQSEFCFGVPLSNLNISSLWINAIIHIVRMAAIK